MSNTISPIAIFWSKPLNHKLLLTRIFLMLCLAGAANLILPFKVYARFLGEINSESARNPQDVDWKYVERIA